MFTRRDFLLASTAAGVAPLLRPFTSTAFAQAGAAPTRIVFVYSPNGVVQKNFWPAGTNLTERPILSPLAAHAKDMVLIRGLGYTGFNTPHSMGTTKALTARDVFGAGGPVAARGVMDMPSLDHLLSKSVGAKNFRPALRLGGHWGNNRGYLMFGDKGEVLAPIGKVEEAFDFTFGGAAGTLTPSPGTTMPSAADLAKAQALRDARKSVLDVVRGDVRALQLRLPAAQKLKMDGALNAISELEKGLLGTGGTAGTGGNGTVAAPVQCKGSMDVQQSVAQGTDEKQKQARIIASAFGCDVSRIAVWKLVASADGGTPFGGYHNLSHKTGTADADAKLTEIAAWQATQISYLATQLKAVKDPLGTGSVFDNTIIYWFNECAHGNHDPSPLPLVLLGSGGGKIETGRVLLPDSTQKKYGNLLLSLAHAMGDTSMVTIGDSNACKGPLLGLLKPGISPA